MTTASLSDIKKELAHLEPKQLQDICLRLAKYKKENKELLSYLLFESHDEAAYVSQAKTEMDDHFETLPKTNLYLAKKVLRKILRIANKHIKYSGIAQTELELRIYFCVSVKQSGIKLQNSQVLVNLFGGQLKKIDAALGKLPEELQYDYEHEIEPLRQYGGSAKK